MYSTCSLSNSDQFFALFYFKIKMSNKILSIVNLTLLCLWAMSLSHQVCCYAPPQSGRWVVPKYKQTLAHNGIRMAFLSSVSTNRGIILEDSEGKWYNPSYSKENIEAWWKEADKSLLTIGSKGVSESQLNSLSELIDSHRMVRVRLASDKMDASAIAASIIDSPRLFDKIELLHIKPREIMVKRK